MNSAVVIASLLGACSEGGISAVVVDPIERLGERVDVAHYGGVDVVLLPDRSSSMWPFEEVPLLHAAALVAQFTEIGADWRLGVRLPGVASPGPVSGPRGRWVSETALVWDHLEATLLAPPPQDWRVEAVGLALEAVMLDKEEERSLVVAWFANSPVEAAGELEARARALELVTPMPDVLWSSVTPDPSEEPCSGLQSDLADLDDLARQQSGVVGPLCGDPAKLAARVAGRWSTQEVSLAVTPPVDLLDEVAPDVFLERAGGGRARVVLVAGRRCGLGELCAEWRSSNTLVVHREVLVGQAVLDVQWPVQP